MSLAWPKVLINLSLHIRCLFTLALNIWFRGLFGLNIWFRVLHRYLKWWFIWQSPLNQIPTSLPSQDARLRFIPVLRSRWLVLVTYHYVINCSKSQWLTTHLWTQSTVSNLGTANRAFCFSLPQAAINAPAGLYHLITQMGKDLLLQSSGLGRIWFLMHCCTEGF